MAIKDQCDSCQNRYTFHCPGEDYDMTSCTHYCKQINLSKEAEASELHVSNIQDNQTENQSVKLESRTTDAITAEMLQSHTEIKGWLAVFLVLSTIGAVVTIIRGLIGLGEEYGSFDFALVVDYAFLVFYCLYAFVQRRPDAVFVAKIVISYALLSRIVLLLTNSISGPESQSPAGLIVGSLLNIAWFLYLCYSKQVSEVIPRGYRKQGKVGWIAIAIWAALLVGAFGYGCYEGTKDLDNECSSPKNTPKISLNTLGINEYSDGVIAFTCPSYLEIKELHSSGEIIFNLTNHNIEATIRSVSDVPSISRDDFEEAWSNWKPSELDTMDYVVDLNQHSYYNGNICYKKIVHCQGEYNDVFWRVAILHNQQSEKVFVISSYDKGDEEYLDEVLETVRFE